LTVVGLIVMRRREGAARFPTPAYPLPPAVFLILVVVMLFLLGANNPLQAALGVAIVALGIPLYFLVFRARLTRNRNPTE